MPRDAVAIRASRVRAVAAAIAKTVVTLLLRPGFGGGVGCGGDRQRRHKRQDYPQLTATDFAAAQRASERLGLPGHATSLTRDFPENLCLSGSTVLLRGDLRRSESPPDARVRERDRVVANEWWRGCARGFKRKFNCSAAQKAGLAPADATKATNSCLRDKIKPFMLGTNYGMSVFGVAEKVGTTYEMRCTTYLRNIRNCFRYTGSGR